MYQKGVSKILMAKWSEIEKEQFSEVLVEWYEREKESYPGVKILKRIGFGYLRLCYSKHKWIQ